MLLRPSELARFWELHPKTVYLWIKSGRLRAVRTPGEQYRVRSEDVPAFCEKSGLALPPQLAQGVRRVMILGASVPEQRAVRRALKGQDVLVSAYASALDGMLAAAVAPPTLLVVSATSVPPEEAVRALKRARATSSTPIVVYALSSSTRADAVLRAGASAAIVRDRDLTTTISDLLTRVSPRK
jgi:excisionase family DNA binding protein